MALANLSVMTVNWGELSFHLYPNYFPHHVYVDSQLYTFDIYYTATSKDGLPRGASFLLLALAMNLAQLLLSSAPALTKL